MKTSILNSTAKVTRQRLAASGSEITLELRCHHDADAVSAALQQALASDCELILICGTSITVDPGDVIPSTIVANGGVIDHFGMPVEPGNMLLLAHCDKRKIINLPGCSRSPKLNGLDWVLARIMAGVEVTAQHIMLMGVGGLIKDIPHVRRKQMLTEPTQEPQQRVAVVILAAGSSKRMGEQNKLLATVGGIPILQRVVTAAQHSMAEAVVVVTGHQREEIETLLADDELQLVHNPDYSSGMASSLRCGLSALADNIDGALIVLGDMPFITAQQIDELIVEFNPNIERDIVAPLRNGRRGNPVLWSKRYFPIMKALKGDTGARKLLLDYAANIWDVPVNNDAIFIDIDTPEALTEVNQSLTAQTTADAP